VTTTFKPRNTSTGHRRNNLPVANLPRELGWRQKSGNRENVQGTTVKVESI